MMMAKFRKRPTVIEAIQFTAEGNSFDLGELLSEGGRIDFNDGHILIHTRGGMVRADLNDWIIRENGELYPIKSDVFILTYEAIDDKG
jgi:hypothetical protein